MENEDRFDVFSKLINSRVLFINDFIDDKSAVDIVAALMCLDKHNHDKITIFINSDGGDIRNIFMIYDIIKSLSSPIETFCIGTAMGESVLLLAAGTKGSRIISKNSDIGVSQIAHNGIGYYDLTNAKISHEKNKKDNEVFLKELSKCTGKSLKIIKSDTQRQLFLTPQEAVKYGIVDKVAQ